MFSWRAVSINAAMLCWPSKGYIERLVRLARVGDVVPMSLCRRIVLVNDPEVVKLIAQAQGSAVSKHTHYYGQFAKCMGQGLLTLDGDAWSAARQRCHQAFWPDSVRAFDGVIGDHVAQWCDDWSHIAKHEGVLDVYEDTATRIFSLSTAILLGESLAPTEARAWFALMSRLGDQSASMPWMTSQWVETGFHRDVATLDRWLMGVAKTSSRKNALLAPVFSALQQGRITDQQYLGEVKNILFGGFDTTSLCLTWGCYELARHEAVQQQCYQALCGGVGADSMGLALYKHCGPVRRLVQEVVRLYPAVYGVERYMDVVPEHLRHLFKDRTLLRISPYLLHRHPKYWQHPLAFYPDRFKQDHPSSHRYAYCPYGLGARNCIGQHLANAIMAKVWATLLPRVGLSLCAAAPIAMGARITLRPAGPVVLKLYARPKATSVAVLS